MPHLVLIGGGHAHMVTMANIPKIIERGHQVTVIGPSEHHYYSGMGPGVLGGTYTAEQIRFNTRQTVNRGGGKFLLDSVQTIDPDQKTVTLKSGNIISYNVLSCNAGSYVPKHEIIKNSHNICSAKPIEKLVQAQGRIVELSRNKKITVAIVGGGPSAAEIAGNIHQLCVQKETRMPSIQIFAGDSGLMHSFPEPVRRRVINSLTQRGIKITPSYVEAIENNQLQSSREKIQAEIIFMATGVRPSPIFKRSGLDLGTDGGLQVNNFLQVEKYPEIFGGGDCIYFKEQPLDKVGVYAVRQNPILYHNLLAALEGREPTPFVPGGDYLLIFNLGDGEGVLHKRWLTFGGKTAFKIKDYIDRRFIRNFKYSA